MNCADYRPEANSNRCANCGGTEIAHSGGLIGALKRRRAAPLPICRCVRVEGLHEEECPLFDGVDMQLAADAILVFAAVLKETGVKKEKIIAALSWALDNE